MLTLISGSVILMVIEATLMTIKIMLMNFKAIAPMI